LLLLLLFDFSLSLCLYFVFIQHGIRTTGCNKIPKTPEQNSCTFGAWILRQGCTHASSKFI
jgi:hypothetical protein